MAADALVAVAGIDQPLDQGLKVDGRSGANEVDYLLGGSEALLMRVYVDQLWLCAAIAA